MNSRHIGRIVLSAGLFAAHAALAADPIKVGVTVALSPPGSVSQGTQSRDAVEVATKMINDAGGVLGRPMELVIEDHQGIPEKARAAMEKLITRDKVVAVVGEHQSSTALAGIEVAHRYHVPYVNVGAAADAIREKGYVEVFNPAPFNTLLAIGVADAMKGLGAKRVVALCENTDFGISLGKVIGDQIKERAPGIEYKYEALDRAGKDFLPVLLPMKSNPPDVIVDCMLAPAAFILINQLYEQGITPKTWLYEVPNADYPDFWQNVSDAAKGMLAFGLYHPNMPMPELSQKVATAYKAKTTYDPNRLLFSGADSVFLVAQAITKSNSTDPDSLINALENLKWTGTRGEISFSLEKGGYRYHQWLDHPHVTYQITAVKQPLAETRILQDGSKPFDSSQLVKQR
jgi:branched-chain amino acid transport system substrate-binding protein